MRRSLIHHGSCRTSESLAFALLVGFVAVEKAAVATSARVDLSARLTALSRSLVPEHEDQSPPVGLARE